jgi:hypothetical protein
MTTRVGAVLPEFDDFIQEARALTRDFDHSISGHAAPRCDEKPVGVDQPIKERK